jgi:hypothetical protein
LWVGKNGQLRAKCFAGCAELAVLAELRCDIAWVAAAPSHAEIEAEIAAAQEAARRAELALKIWNTAQPLTEDRVAIRYLRETRGLALPTLPVSLRQHANLYHNWSGTWWPALVARIDDAFGELAAVHRTWLDPNTGNKAPVTPPRAMLGPQRHGAIQLIESRGNNELLVAEGTETALAAGELDRWQRSVWAAISASGLMALHVPRRFDVVVIAADHDANGAGMHAANVLAHRLRKNRVHARVVLPPEVGTDWNDMLVAKKKQGTAA